MASGSARRETRPLPGIYKQKISMMKSAMCLQKTAYFPALLATLLRLTIYSGVLHFSNSVQSALPDSYSQMHGSAQCMPLQLTDFACNLNNGTLTLWGRN